jgi:hypothetical protein
VVLGGDDGVAHPGRRGERDPLPRVIQVRVEVVEVPLVLGVGHPLVVPHPLVPARQRVQAPVHEQPEPAVPEPGDRIVVFSHEVLP